MQRRLAVAAIAMMVVCFASVAEAQRGAGGPGGRGGFGGPGGGGAGGNIFALLQIEAVQKELELTDEQVTEIREVLASLRGQRGERGQRGQRGQQGERGQRRRPQGDDNSRLQAPAGQSFVAFLQDEAQDEDRRARFEQLRQQQQERTAAAQAKLEEILLPHQMKRLKEIYIQVAGVAALQDPSVAKDLGISEEQQTKMGEVRREAMASMREAFQGGDRENIRERIAEMRSGIEEKVLGVLTADQKQKFEAMKGEKFELPEGALRGGGRQGGPGGQQGQRRARPDA